MDQGNPVNISKKRKNLEIDYNEVSARRIKTGEMLQKNIFAIDASANQVIRSSSITPELVYADAFAGVVNVISPLHHDLGDVENDSEEVDGNLISAHQSIHPKEYNPVDSLIYLVMNGEESLAEEMIKTNQELLLKKGSVADPAGRVFDDITAFQYALWARDWYMWEMMLPYMDIAEASEQYDCIVKHGTSHGHQFDFSPLIKTIQDYVRSFNEKSYEEHDQHWGNEVGDEQRLLPMHVVQEYCRTDRSFASYPDFSEGVRGKEFKVDMYYNDAWHYNLEFKPSYWFPTDGVQEECEGGNQRLGWLGASSWDSSSTESYVGRCPCRGGGISKAKDSTYTWKALPDRDLSSIQNLSDAREEQFEELGKILSNAAVPSAISP